MTADRDLADRWSTRDVAASVDVLGECEPSLQEDAWPSHHKREAGVFAWLDVGMGHQHLCAVDRTGGGWSMRSSSTTKRRCAGCPSDCGAADDGWGVDRVTAACRAGGASAPGRQPRRVHRYGSRLAERAGAGPARLGRRPPRRRPRGGPGRTAVQQGHPRRHRPRRARRPTLAKALVDRGLLTVIGQRRGTR